MPHVCHRDAAATPRELHLDVLPESLSDASPSSPHSPREIEG
jgi:hypothetical protein